MPDPIPSSAEPQKPAGPVTPAPTGGQPAQPTPAAEPKPGEPAVKPLIAPVIKAPAQPTPTPATPTPGAPAVKPGATPTPGAKPEQQTVPISAMHEERTKRQNLELEIQQLRDMVQQNQVTQPQPQVQQESAMRLEIDKLWDSDPKKAVQAEIMVAMNYRDQVDAQLSQQAQQLNEKYKDFSTYRNQAESYVRNLPVDQRADPRVMEVAYLVVRGQNVDQIVEQQKNDLFKQFQSGELAQQFAQPAGTFSAPQLQPGVQLTQDQLNAAQMMGMTPEDYSSQIQNKAPVGPQPVAVAQ